MNIERTSHHAWYSNGCIIFKNNVEVPTMKALFVDGVKFPMNGKKLEGIRMRGDYHGAVFR